MMRRSSVTSVLVASLALFGCAENQRAQVRDEVVKEAREEASLATERPLIVADVLRLGDAKIVTNKVAGRAFVTRQKVGYEVTVGFQLARGDLVELTPETRLQLDIDGRPAELSSLERSVWYKLE